MTDRLSEIREWHKGIPDIPGTLRIRDNVSYLLDRLEKAEAVLNKIKDDPQRYGDVYELDSYERGFANGVACHSLDARNYFREVADEEGKGWGGEDVGGI